MHEFRWNEKKKKKKTKKLASMPPFKSPSHVVMYYTLKRTKLNIWCILKNFNEDALLQPTNKLNQLTQQKYVLAMKRLLTLLQNRIYKANDSVTTNLVIPMVCGILFPFSMICHQGFALMMLWLEKWRYASSVLYKSVTATTTTATPSSGSNNSNNFNHTSLTSASK